ncbi:hypothetical protein ND748_11760 [Frankia sp. AiPs1]|uniref:hypothetical protein n=1 Tax=Frankia sp. AiPs1 TaxID=573493 RepID=UPI00204491E6|nr:hypothetical protein [Frankia sp. AiPs1]MCM3922331.1 hypothetical protein [Frankia sp. AiPs1]
MAVSAFSAGVVSGNVVYQHRSSVRAEHSAGTAAWDQHLAVLILAGALAVVAWVRRRRCPAKRRVRGALPVPLGRRAARRIGLTALAVRRHPTELWRLAVLAALAVVLLYLCWRAGIQVLAGLDPNFTVNAWGGPSYAGAMACHYLDLAVIAAVVVGLLDRALLPVPVGRA